MVMAVYANQQMYLEKNTDRTDAGYARSDQSLPPDGGLHPHALRSCYSFEPPALAYRSRFGVARQMIS